jgi:hypothetical protein
MVQTHNNDIQGILLRKITFFILYGPTLSPYASFGIGEAQTFMKLIRLRRVRTYIKLDAESSTSIQFDVLHVPQ